MAFFIPSSIQKRLLRYALSRIQLFDADALDLDRLDIGLGKRSNIELRDVALRKAELSKILSLPQALSVHAALVSSLRLTIPADVYASAIVVQVKGVEVVLDLKAAFQRQEKREHENARQRAPGGPRGSAEHAGFTQNTVIPTPEDLAKSFLQQEPPPEAAQLEAEITSQSADLQQSVPSSETEDDAPGYGTGGNAVLPGFLAGFFAGVADRLEIVVEDVTLRLDMELSPPAGSSNPESSAPAPSIPISLKYDVEKLDIEGVTTNNVDDKQTPKDEESRQKLKTGKRRVCLGDVKTRICCARDDLSRLLGAKDDEKSQESFVHNRSGGGDSGEDATSEQGQCSNMQRLDDASGNAPLVSSDLMGFPSASAGSLEDTKASYASLDPGHMADVETEEESGTENEENWQSRESERRDRLLDSGNLSQNSIHNTLHSFRRERFPLDRRRLRQEKLPLDAPPHQPDPAISIVSPLSGSTQDGGSLYMESANRPSASMTPSGVSTDTATPADDMAESKYFSHDEAASIYMSVMDEEKDDTTENEDAHRMPGAWGESSDIQAKQHKAGTEPKPVYTIRNTDSGSTTPPMRNTQDPSTPWRKNDLDEGMTSAFDHRGDEPHEQEGSSGSHGDKEIIDRCLIQARGVQLWLPSLTSTPSELDADQNSNFPGPYHDPAESRMTNSRVTALPGSFSVYAESATLARSQVSGAPSAAVQQNAGTHPKSPTGTEGTLDIDIDIDQVFGACSFEELALIQRLVDTLQAIFATAAYPSTVTEKPQTARSNKSIGRSIALRSTLNDLSLAITLQHEDADKDGATMQGSSRENEKFLELHLSNAYMNLTSGNDELTQAEFGIGQAKLDAGGQKLVRFDQEALMNSSVKDTQLLTGRDISVLYTLRNGAPEINMSTLPLVMELDATKLDDTLNSIGGFSALLEVGSSVVSDATTDPRRSTQPMSTPRVHFKEDPSPSKTAKLQNKHPSTKINVRLNGSSVTLRAGERTFEYNSTAIKSVLRSGAIGLQIDDSKLTGPYVCGSRKSELASIRARNLNLRFLDKPEEQDLTRLISLVTPSKDNFERGDGGVMVETLIRQRQNGPAARMSLSKLSIEVDSSNILEQCASFVNDLTRLGAITKYLPEETRPGLLALLHVHDIDIGIAHAPLVGNVACNFSDLELANVSAPSLLAMNIRGITVKRNAQQELVHSVLPRGLSEHEVMLMVRLVGEEVVPVVEMKLMNTCVEYDVSVLMDMLDISDSAHGLDALAQSIVALRDDTRSLSASELQMKQVKPIHATSSSSMTSLKVDLGVRDCTMGLTPRRLPSKALFVTNNARLQINKGYTGLSSTDLELRKAALLLTDDRMALSKLPGPDTEAALKIGQQIPHLCSQGYVSICWISAAHAFIAVQKNADDNIVDIEFDDELFVLESCADSTSTLMELLSALQPPAPPSTGTKYQTEVTTVEDMMASFVGEGFPVHTRSSRRGGGMADTAKVDVEPDDLGQQNEPDDFGDDQLSEDGSHDSSVSEFTMGLDLDATGRQPNEFDALFDTRGGGLSPTSLPQQAHATASKWDSDRNRYVPVSQSEVLASPFKLQIKNMHIIWNVHDGYDWPKTRGAISKAVSDLEAKSEEKRHRHRQLYEEDNEPEPVIGDFLFNSIYVGIPVNQDPQKITRQINRNVDDFVSETASHATTATDATLRPHRAPNDRPKKLKLERSQRHKLTFELSGVSADMFVYPPGQETVSSTDVRIRDFDIFDHVPTSTWKKFMTYMHDAGPREDRKPMMHIEICNVKPMPDLLASELVVRATVLPVRLHVDQDALDFMTRFFAFNDGTEKREEASGNQPYIQRVEVLPVPIKLDYKPKKVDYVGLRSGRTKEFMNFFNLDSADMVLKHAIIYGCSSFARLHSSLEDIWMPDITTKQLPAVLSGLNGVRTIVNVGTGVRNLVTVPVQEYRKDGRIVRSISKGALSFARTSGSELTKFGAKLAVGAQNALQGAEDFLAGPRQANDADWERAEFDEDEKRAFSHYADQPTGILQGLKGAAKSLERDLLTTRDVVVAVSGEARESGSFEGAARAVARRAPTIVLRPMIGASRAVSQTLMGATNTVDPQNRRRIEDKYKRY